MFKSKRGETIVVRQKTSSTALHGKTTHYERYFLARATRVNRQGIVEEYMRLNCMPERVNKFQQVLVISDADKQEAAAALYPMGLEWPTPDALKAAILENTRK